ncbi:MAG: DeoR/GlpR family DNA-binding transcription regulator [Longicatena sp.]
MYEEERKIKILNQLNYETSVSVQELSNLLNVSSSTIRRDLTNMEKNGVIKRTHGGAMVVKDVADNLNYDSKKIKNYDLKIKIAQLAAKQIDDGDIISLNSSTITSLMPQFITAKNFTIITNSLNIATSLKTNEQCNLILLGGLYMKTAETIEGPMTVSQIKTMRYSKSFFGANGIDPTFGFSSASELESASKIATINQSTTSYFLCENTKFNRTSLHKICDLNKVTYLITDDEAKKEDIELYSTYLPILVAK